MKVLSIISFKGGTAKTSSTQNIGAFLAKYHKKKVLLIDFDAQANLTAGFGFDPDENDSMAAVLQEKKQIAEVIQRTSIPNLDLIPSDSFLERIEMSEELITDRYSHEKLKSTLALLKGTYDFVMIDTPPSLCWLTESALIATDHCIVNATPEFYSVKGLERLSAFLEHIKKRHPFSVLGVILSFWNKRGKSNNAFLSVIEETFPSKPFETKIRRDIAVAEASAFGKALLEVFPHSRAFEDYKNITKELIARL